MFEELSLVMIADEIVLIRAIKTQILITAIIFMCLKVALKTKPLFC